MGKGKWCLEELEFYGQNDEKLARNPSFGSAQTEYGSVYIGKGRPDMQIVASRAFDGITGKRDSDDTYYCSKTKWGTGWLAYDFKTPTKVICFLETIILKHIISHFPFFFTTTPLRIMPSLN